jgi:hypothetical protein
VVRLKLIVLTKDLRNSLQQIPQVFVCDERNYACPGGVTGGELHDVIDDG